MLNKLKEIEKISKRLNRIINNQSGKTLTALLEKATNKVDNKWEVTSQINKSISNYFRKKLKEHTVLAYIRKQENYIDKLMENRNKRVEDFDMDFKKCIKASKYIRNKTTLISSVQGGGAALAGAPFTLLETFLMFNALWEKIELTALVFDIKPYTYFEKVYIFYIICISISDSKEDKVKIYKELIKLENMIDDKKISLMDQYGHVNLETIVKDFTKVIINPLVSSKLTQTIPVVGVGFGSITSGQVVKNTLILAQLLYLRRYFKN